VAFCHLNSNQKQQKCSSEKSTFSISTLKKSGYPQKTRFTKLHTI